MFRSLAIFISIFICAGNLFAATNPYVRVLILKDAQSVPIKINGHYEVVDKKTGSILSQGASLSGRAELSGGNIFIGEIKTDSRALLIRPDQEAVVKVGPKSFRGEIEIIRNNSGGLLVVNHLNLEDYVKGILYHEVSHYWPQEALKAQAVVCRSYALYQISQNTLKDFDLTSDIYSQVYGGKGSERYRTNQAVDQTKGEIILSAGKIFPAYFHAVCAGHTEDASVLWNTNDPALRGRVCSFCKGSPHFYWDALVSKEELVSKFPSLGAVKDIQGVVIASRTKSGRVKTLKFIISPKDVIVPAKDLRQALGPNLIRSTDFKLKLSDKGILFQGSGWGHGVGMCQWGAYFMAKQGYKYNEILRYYYPGVEISNAGKL
ncbi:MAG: SpoIID/LytB domain-containing protein [Candidatus Omnitrophica bacterium]|jgi:stage II sporulation protein D|nr:SpoIID/LytB domain-containing protein [Candidatus Omnitrophota bacterium]